MKNKLITLSLAMAMVFGVGYVSSTHKDEARAEVQVNLNIFFNDLTPYGHWDASPRYGHIWYPANVGASWRPYTNGYWQWSDQGWFWSSYEPFGWATYHYGRWVFVPGRGWGWVPGVVWAPAWVTWYTGTDYVGWAPLPPDDRFYAEINYGPDYDYDHYDNYYNNYDIPYNHRVFVPSRSFLNRRLNTVVVRPTYNVNIVRKVKHVTNIRVVNKRIVNNGPDFNFIQKRTKTRISRINVAGNNKIIRRADFRRDNKNDRDYRRDNRDYRDPRDRDTRANGKVIKHNEVKYRDRNSNDNKWKDRSDRRVINRQQEISRKRIENSYNEKVQNNKKVINRNNSVQQRNRRIESRNQKIRESQNRIREERVSNRNKVQNSSNNNVSNNRRVINRENAYRNQDRQKRIQNRAEIMKARNKAREERMSNRNNAQNSYNNKVNNNRRVENRDNRIQKQKKVKESRNRNNTRHDRG